VHEHDGLGRALLAGVTKSIVIRLPSHIVNLVLSLGHVWSKNLPVVASILESNFAIKLLNQVLSNLGGTSKERHPGIALFQDLLHYWAVAVNKVHVFLGQATVVQHPDPLLERPGAASVGLNQRLVSHVEGAHKLQHRDLNREVERSDHSNAAVRESPACAHLAMMVSGHLESLGEESDLIASKVFEEVPRDSNLSLSLSPAFGNRRHHRVNEEVEHLLVMQNLGRLPSHGSKHQVALLVQVRVVQAESWHLSQRVDKRLNLLESGIWNFELRLPSERVDNVFVVGGGGPFTSHQVHSLVLSSQVLWIASGKGLQVSAEAATIDFCEIAFNCDRPAKP